MIGSVVFKLAMSFASGITAEKMCVWASMGGSCCFFALSLGLPRRGVQTALLGYEVCVGIYLNAMGMMRSKHIPQEVIRVRYEGWGAGGSLRRTNPLLAVQMSSRFLSEWVSKAIDCSALRHPQHSWSSEAIVPTSQDRLGNSWREGVGLLWLLHQANRGGGAGGQRRLDGGNRVEFMTGGSEPTSFTVAMNMLPHRMQWVYHRIHP